MSCEMPLTRSSSVEAVRHLQPGDAEGNQGREVFTHVAQPALIGGADGVADRLDVGQPVGAAVVLAEDSELGQAPSRMFVAAVREFGGLGDDPHAPDGMNGGAPLVVRLVAGLEHHHADEAVALQGVRDHLAVARSKMCRGRVAPEKA